MKIRFVAGVNGTSAGNAPAVGVPALGVPAEGVPAVGVPVATSALILALVPAKSVGCSGDSQAKDTSSK